MAHKIYLKKLFKVLIEHRTSGIYDAFLHCSVFRERYVIAGVSWTRRPKSVFIHIMGPTFTNNIMSTRQCQHKF